MKKHNTFKIILGFILFLILLTWIIPGSVFQDKVVDQGLVQMGLFDFSNYLLTALSYFGHFFIYIIAVGGFYGVLYKVPAYHKLLDTISKKVAGKGKIVLSLIMIILAVLVSILGIDFEILILVPFLVSLILLMGYDKIVVAITIIGSILVGVAGSTFAYGKVGLISSQSMLSLDIYSDILIKVVVLVVGLALLIFNALLYIKRFDGVKIKESKDLKKEDSDSMMEDIKNSDLESKSKKIKKNDTKSEKKDDKETNAKKAKSSSTKKVTSKVAEKKTTTKKSTTSKSSAKTTSSKKTKKDTVAALKDDNIIVAKNEENTEKLIPNSAKKETNIWPFFIGGILFVLILILAYIPWPSVFKINVFDNLQKQILELKVFDFPLFAKILGQFNAFGKWNVADIMFLMFIFAILMTFIYNVKIDDIFDGLFDGIKKAIKPAVIIVLIYSVLVLVTYHPFQLTIYKSLMSLFKGFNIFTTALTMMLSSLFNGDIVYVLQSTIPYIVSVIADKDLNSIISVMMLALYGATMLIAPTSIVLMTVLTYLDVKYTDWLKNIWKFFVEFVAVILIIIAILVFI